MEFSKQILRLIYNQVRCMSNVSKPKNHYDSLGLNPKSTQNEIKSAYYKLSMVYHPDKNNDEASLQKFRDITEAYEVLGNIKTRRLYDKGLYFKPGTSTTDPTVDKFHKSRETGSKPSPPDGRTPIYDFDEWAKNHYGATFQRQKENKRRAQEYRKFREKQVWDKKLEGVVFIMTTFFLICMICNQESNYDSVNIGTYGPFVTPKRTDTSDNNKTK